MIRPSCLVACLLLSGSPLHAQLVRGVPDVSDDRGAWAAVRAHANDEMRHLLSIWVEAWNGQDVQGITDVLTRNAMVAVPGHPVVRGIGEVSDSLGVILRDQPHIIVTPADFASTGEMAYLTADIRPSASNTAVPVGRVVLIGMRGSDNRWRVRSLVVSLDGDRTREDDEATAGPAGTDANE